MDNKLLDFITSSNLFDEFNVENSSQQLVNICNRKDRFEMFCPECGDKKVFIYDSGFSDIEVKNIINALSSTGSLNGSNYLKHDPIEIFDHWYFCFKCSLNESHKMEYFFTKRGSKIIKVGQYPSYRDIENPQIKKFRKLLGDYYPELSTAIRLFSVNVGIGSFVYLRRIIEKLVYDAFKEAESAGKLTEQEFEYRKTKDENQIRNGIEEKIKLLKGFLPDMMTDQPQIYGVVSTGIHELSEEECLKYFPVLKDGIVMILDGIVARNETEKAETAYKKSLGGIISEIK